jgi:tetratricopeptide (TPR) repeat protein
MKSFLSFRLDVVNQCLWRGDTRVALMPKPFAVLRYQYDFEVTGNQLSASQTLEVWKYAFPEEFQPANSLAYSYNVLGDFDRAAAEAREAIRRNPAHGFPYSNLAHAYRGLGKFDEAQRTAEEAVKRNIETLPTRRLLYQLAILAGDPEAATRHLEWCRDKPREFEVVAARAQVAACSGKLREARELFQQTERMAEESNLADVGTNYLAWVTWMEMAFGNTDQALAGARRILERNPSYDPKLRAALILTIDGLASEAESIVNDLVKKIRNIRSSIQSWLRSLRLESLCPATSPRKLSKSLKSPVPMSWVLPRCSRRSICARSPI